MEGRACEKVSQSDSLAVKCVVSYESKLLKKVEFMSGGVESKMGK